MADGIYGLRLDYRRVFPLIVYLVHYRNAMTKLRGMNTPEAHLVFDEDTYTLSSGAGISTLPWSSIKEIWCFNDFWIVLLSRAHFWTLPLRNLNTENQTFIMDRVRKAGGKINEALPVTAKITTGF